jgi:phytoene desaturase
MTKDVVVIGAGLGGMAAAVRLSAAGCKVSVLEKNSTPGGKLGYHVSGGYRFDTGPSLLTMPYVLEALFRDIGRELTDYLELIELPKTCRYFYPDGTVFDASSNPSAMQTNIARFSPEDAEVWPAYQEYCKNLYHRAAEIFLFNPIHEWRRLMFSKMIRKLPGILNLDAGRSMHSRNNRFFKDPRMVQMLDRYATYNGSDPFRAPATLNIIAHVEYNPGAYYIRGGMYKLAQVLEKLCVEYGVEIRYDQPVRAVIHQNGCVTGVETDNGTVHADTVVCNADVIHSFNHLIAGQDKFKNKLNRLEPSLSGMVFLWSVGRQHPSLLHHNIFFSADYESEFRQIFEAHKVPDDPTVYVSITAKSDPADAPNGCENWFVMVNMPYTCENQNWSEFQKYTRRAALTKLSAHGFDIGSDILKEHVLTPVYFRERLNSNRGSIYGISSNSRFTAFMRPPNRNRQIKNLFFAGGSAHPGGGIPLVLLSGKICAEMILNG